MCNKFITCVAYLLHIYDEHKNVANLLQIVTGKCDKYCYKSICRYMWREPQFTSKILWKNNVLKTEKNFGANR